MKRIFSFVLAGMVGGLAGGGLLWWLLLKPNEPRVEPGVPSERSESHGFRASERAKADRSTSHSQASPAKGVIATQTHGPVETAPVAAGAAPDESASARDENAERETAREAIAVLEAERAKAAKLSSRNAAVIREAVIPVPSEVFNALDKLGKPAWSKALHPLHGVRSPSGSSVHIALVLGTVIAEGFIAVEAENVDEVKNAGRSVSLLAEALGVRSGVLRYANEIVTSADRKDWTAVRRELDHVLQEVKSGMAGIRSEDLVQLVILGGWLRATEALASVVLADYSADAANLFHQELLVDWFQRRFDRFRGTDQDQNLTSLVHGVDGFRKLMETSEPAISEASVDRIGAKATGLLALIDKRFGP